jgi:uncharacterized Zn-finger protein
MGGDGRHRQYQCSFPGCKKDFSREDNFKRHLKTHEHRKLKI